MLPNRKIALSELELAGKMNPGPWTDHSMNVAKAAELIAEACGLDREKAFVCGLLHDIGRRTGIAAVRHIIDGYDYAMSKGWNEAARVCLTHSFPIKDIDADIGKKDITAEQYNFIKAFIVEKRFVDTTRRYGIFPFTVDRWNKTIEFKEYFEKMIGRSIYTLLPNIEKCIYN